MPRLLLICLAIWGSENETAPAAEDPALALSATIDNALAARWEADGITPSPLADDAEFLRRAALDLAGKIPSVSETRRFLDDPSADKRQALIDRLLESPAYVVHFTNVWRDAFVPEAGADVDSRVYLPGFEAWLRKQLTDETRYDLLVRQLLATSETRLSFPLDGPFNMASPSPALFFQLKQQKPESLAAGTARIFLGLRLECAECHDHPFDAWKQAEFWGFAAFFAGLDDRDRPVRQALRPGPGALQIPGTETVVAATFLGGQPLSPAPAVPPRTALVDWITAPENPWFARAAVNRLWGHMFGVGLVEPVDDFGPSNPASHPELLDELARQFVAHDYDVKYVLRALANSRAYQLTSRQSKANAPPRSFAQMSVKGLTPQQLFNSLAQATGYFRPFNGQDPFVVEEGSPQAEFYETFSNESQSRTEQQATILQALAMMNGSFVSEATDFESGRTLAAVVEYPWLETAGRIETLYLAALCRPPRPDELAPLVAYVEGEQAGPPAESLADIFWALLNSSEFLVNH